MTQFTPGFSIVEKGARSSLNGSVSIPMLLYARTGSNNNKVYPSANLVGNVEALEKLFFIDGAVTVSQQYLNPLGSRPSSLATVTSNRYTAETYRISPYFKGVARGDINYELRDSNTWSNSSGTQLSTNRSYTNEALATVAKDPAPLGWSVEYNRASIKFPDQAALVTQLERARVIWQIDPQLQLFTGAGYENNHYIFADFRDSTYNVGGGDEVSLLHQESTSAVLDGFRNSGMPRRHHRQRGRRDAGRSVGCTGHVPRLAASAGGDRPGRPHALHQRQQGNQCR